MNKINGVSLLHLHKAKQLYSQPKQAAILMKITAAYPDNGIPEASW